MLYIYIHNKLLTIYFNDYKYSANNKKEEIDKKYDPSNCFLEGWKYNILKKKVNHSHKKLSLKE